MNCPVCSESALKRESLEKDLMSHTCPSCGGLWIGSTDYADWLDKAGERLPEKPFTDISIEVKDNTDAKLCPGCGRIMVKYKVGHGLDFHLDRCGGCGGVWLDANEWSAMKARNLHDEIGSVFTAPWQAQIREEETALKLDRIYENRFGGEDYGKVKEFRKWLDSHPQRQAILHFLNDESPYKA